MFIFSFYVGRTKDNFDLIFDRTVQGFAESSFHKPIQEFTIAFWVKVSSEDTEAGTVLSYAVKVGCKFVLLTQELDKHMTGLVFFITE